MHSSVPFTLSPAITALTLPSGSSLSTISTCASELTTSSHFPISGSSFVIPYLGPGDYVDITYKTYRCCPSDHNALASNFSDPEYFDVWQMSVKNMVNECETPVGATYSPNPQNTGPRMLHMTQRTLPGPTYLTGGVSPFGCASGNRHVYQVQNLVFCEEDPHLASPHYTINSQFFDPMGTGTVNGQLRVRITTQRGLNVDPFTDVSIQDDFGTTAIPYSSVITLTSYGTGGIHDGGKWEFYFSLSTLAASLGSGSYDNLKAFLDNSVFNFPLTPCCKGEPVPTYSLEWEINPYNSPDSRGCDACWIPLAKSEGSIHLMCPGCVTPGVIVDDVKLMRTTAGWPDHDDNGLADAGSSRYADVGALLLDPYADSHAGSVFMPGDQLSCDILAHGQDGDNTNEGFDYVTLMNEWALHTPVDHFDYLNISITEPCIGNWTTTDATLQIKIPGTSVFVPALPLIPPFPPSPGLSLSPFLNSSSTSRVQIYNIPYSALPSSSFIQYDVNDEYKVHFAYDVCQNGPAGDCDYDVVMWWSTIAHNLDNFTGSSSAYVEQAGIPNEAILPTSTSALDRVIILPHNLRYYCEGRGSSIHGYHIEKSYTSNWSNSTLTGGDWNVRTCKKRYSSNIHLWLSDIGRSTNLFIKEYRPIDIRFIDDNYLIPPLATSPLPYSAPEYTYDQTKISSTVITYSPGSSITHPISYTTALPTESRIITPYIPPLLSRVQYAFTPLSPPTILPFSISKDGSSPFSPSSTTSPYLFMGDENSSFILDHFYIPSACPDPLHPVADGRSQVTMSNTGNFVTIQDNLCGSVSPEVVNVSSPTVFTLLNPNPVLTLTQPPGATTVDVYSIDPTCFSVTLTNTSGSTLIADNAFVYINAPLPTLEIFSVGITTSVPAVAISPVISTTGPGNYFLVNIPHLRSHETVTL